MPVDVLDDDDGIVHHEPDRDGQRHQRQVVEAEAQRVHDGGSAKQRYRHHRAWDERRAQIAQEHEDHQHHEGDGEHQRELDVEHRGADRHRAVADHIDLHARRNDVSKFRQGAIDALDGLDHVRAGLLEHDQENARLAVRRSTEEIILGAANRLTHVPDADRRALLIGQDDVAVIGWLHDLVVGRHRKALDSAVDRALGGVGGGTAQNVAHLLQGQAARGELFRVHLHTDGRLLLTCDKHQRHAANLRDLLRENVLGVVVGLGKRHRIGRYRKDQE